MARKVRIDLSLDNTHSLSDFPISIYSGTTSGTTTELVYANITSGPVEFEVEDSDLNIVNGEHPFLFVRFSSDGCHDEIVKVPVPRVDCEMCVSFIPYGQPPTATPEPTPNPTNEPTPNPTASPTPSETPDATPEPTPNPTNEPTPNPTPNPTNEPTPEPTADPTPNPTAEPTPNPTPNPTAEPTPEPTESIIVAAVRLTNPYTSSEDACDGSNKNHSNHAYILASSNIFTLVNGYLVIDGSQLTMAGSVDYDLYYGDETISTNSLEQSMGTVNGQSPSGWYLVDATSTSNSFSTKILATVNDTNNPTTISFSICTPGPTPEPTPNEQTDLLKIIDCDNLPANPGSPYYLVDQSQVCIGNQLSLSTSLISEGDVILYTVGGENCGGEVNCAEVQPGTWTGTPSALRYGESISPSCGDCQIP